MKNPSAKFERDLVKTIHKFDHGTIGYYFDELKDSKGTYWTISKDETVMIATRSKSEAMQKYDHIRLNKDTLAFAIDLQEREQLLINVVKMFHNCLTLNEQGIASVPAVWEAWKHNVNVVIKDN